MDKSRIYGWISPSGHFYDCDVLGHSKALKKIPEGRAVVEGIDDEIDDAKRECQKMEEEYGTSTHAEWHVVDMLETDYLHNLYEAAYDAKFIRVGQNGSELHFEARPEVWLDKHQFCRDLAENYDKRPVFVPRKNG